MLDTLARIASAPTSPRLETHAEALEHFPGLSLDEYALARVVNSEFDSGTPVELACIADAEVNQAEAHGQSLFQHITGGTGQFGGQGGRLPVASSRAPGPRHVVAALSVVRRGMAFPFIAPPLRGVAHGARRFFNPKVQDELHRRDPSSHSCSALGLLKAWTYALERCNGGSGGPRCCSDGMPRANARRGSGQEEWVGPVAGVDAFRLMLMRPAGPQQDELYAEAVKVIESGGSYKGRPMLPLPELLLVAALVGAHIVLQGVA